MNEYIKEIIDSKHQLQLERAVDEYLQAERELIVEATSYIDDFVDNAIDDVDDVALDAMIDADANIDLGGEDVVNPIDFVDSSEMSDIDTILDTDPEVMELDLDDDMIDVE